MPSLSPPATFPVLANLEREREVTDDLMAVMPRHALPDASSYRVFLSERPTAELLATVDLDHFRARDNSFGANLIVVVFYDVATGTVRGTLAVDRGSGPVASTLSQQYPAGRMLRAPNNWGLPQHPDPEDRPSRQAMEELETRLSECKEDHDDAVSRSVLMLRLRFEGRLTEDDFTHERELLTPGQEEGTLVRTHESEGFGRTVEVTSLG